MWRKGASAAMGESTRPDWKGTTTDTDRGRQTQTEAAPLSSRFCSLETASYTQKKETKKEKKRAR